MTDNEIIKALECCGKNPPMCSECGYKGRCNRIDCYDYLKRDALNLINRQKAEFERHSEHIELLDIEHEAIRNNAIRDCCRKLMEKVHDKTRTYLYMQRGEAIELIFNHIREMAGDTNAEATEI